MQTANECRSDRATFTPSPMVTTVRTYLEMLQPPGAPPGPTPLGAVLRPTNPCPVPLYRRLYGEVGEPWQWFERRYWTDDTLAAHLARPDVRVVVLEVDGTLAGYYELQDHPADGSVEIAYFGLLPDRVGQGLGGWFLQAALEDAWVRSPRCVWLHTCGLDHPAALPNYLRRGFHVTRTEVVPVTPRP